MRICDICIDRPVFASVLSFALIIFGFIGYQNVDTQYFPTVDLPIAKVSVTYDGASPSLMKNEVTQKLENALINVRGLNYMSSTSKYNHATINLTFDDGTNMIRAMGDVRNKISEIRTQLPQDINAPSISEGGVATPVLNVGFLDKSLTPAKIHSYVSQNVQPLLQNLPGMGAIWLYGAGNYAMRIWLNPQKMASLNITVTDVETALTNNNINFSGGSVEGADRKYSLVADTKLSDVKQFQKMILRSQGGNIVRMEDVAKIALGSSSLTPSPMRTNGVNSIDMEVRPLRSANPISVATEAKKELAKLKLPKGMKMVITYDQSTYLKAAINESFETLIIAIVLVMIVVFLFLGSIRGAFIPITTIPVCVISVFGVIWLCGYSVNVITLLAIILAIGLVVDDAIVVLENIHRHLEKGLDRVKAAKVGSHEIGFSVIAMTLTLAAVYAPSGFAHGFSAKIFQEFAFTLAGAVLISGFVALTLSPMMCAKVLPDHGHVSHLQAKVDRVFHRINNAFRCFLSAVLKRRLWIGVILIVIGLLGYGVYKIVPQSFIPKEDIGFFQVDITSPPGSTVSYTDGFMRQFEKVYAKTPGIENYLSFINAGSAINFIINKPWEQRTNSTEQIMNNVLDKISKIPGVLVKGELPDPVSYGDGSGGQAVQIKIMSATGSYLEIEKTIEKVERVLHNYPGLRSIDSNLKFDNQVYQIHFKRNAAATYGVPLQSVADTLSIMMSGRHITDIERNGQNYDVKVQMQMKDLANLSSLSKLYVRSTLTDDGGNAILVPLSNLISLNSAVRQNTLHRYNRQDSATISASLVPGYDIGEVVDYLNQVLPGLVPQGQTFTYSGRILSFLKSQGVMLGLFFLSVVFIYLVLAAQFESFVDPFIILLTVPFSIVGALAVLWAAGGSVNLYTQIGLITLVGLITKHGILITQFANERLKAGEALLDAVINAATIRLRPILMTTFAMVLGAVPLALATGPGSNSHSQIGWVIVGGMLFGTFFSLVVVPVAYVYFARFDHKKKRLLRAI